MTGCDGKVHAQIHAMTKRQKRAHMYACNEDVIKWCSHACMHVMKTRKRDVLRMYQAWLRGCVGRGACVQQSVVRLQSKYRLDQPEFFFSLSKKIFSGFKYPEHIFFNFENRSTAKNLLPLSCREWNNICIYLVDSSSSVILSSKLNNLLLGYFGPVNMTFYDTNEWWVTDVTGVNKSLLVMF